MYSQAYKPRYYFTWTVEIVGILMRPIPTAERRVHACIFCIGCNFFAGFQLYTREYRIDMKSAVTCSKLYTALCLATLAWISTLSGVESAITIGDKVIYVKRGDSAVIKFTVDQKQSPTIEAVIKDSGSQIGSLTNNIDGTMSVTVAASYLTKAETVCTIIATTATIVNGTTKEEKESMEVTIKIFEPAKIKITPTLVTLGVQSGSWTTMSCAATGTAPIQTLWHKTGVDGPISDSPTVELHNEWANATGNYKCSAENQLNGETFTDAKDFIVRVQPEPPKLVSVDSTKCGPGANITWEPDVLSVGLEHRFTFRSYEGNNASNEMNKTFIPNANGTQWLLITSLERMMDYKLMITDCSGKCVWSDWLTFTTGVLPPPTVAPNVTQTTKNGHCHVIWSPPPSECEITEYLVIVKSIYKYPTVASAPQGESYTVTEANYLFQPKPNRIYSFQVSAKNCVALGNKTTATGSCVTERAAPNSIKAPQIVDKGISSGQADVTIFLDDEANGAISCYFVIVQKTETGKATDTEPYTIERLKTAADATGNPQMDEYVALALRRRRDGTGITIHLGNDSFSVCDINDTESSGSTIMSGSGEGSGGRKNTEYYGRNLPLEDDGRYRVFVVSVTPADGTYYFQKSDIILMPPDSVPLVAIILPVCVFLLLIILIIVILVWRKRRAQSQYHSGAKGEATGGTDAENITVHSDASGPLVQSKAPTANGEHNYENLRRTRESDAGDVKVQDAKASTSGAKENASFVGIEVSASQNAYENLRVQDGAEAVKASEGQESDGLYMAMNSPSASSKGNKTENFYLEPMSNPALVGDATYMNLRPTSAVVPETSDALYDNVDNSRSRPPSAQV